MSIENAYAKAHERLALEKTAQAYIDAFGTSDGYLPEEYAHAFARHNKEAHVQSVIDTYAPETQYIPAHYVSAVEKLAEASSALSTAGTLSDIGEAVDMKDPRQRAALAAGLGGAVSPGGLLIPGIAGAYAAEKGRGMPTYGGATIGGMAGNALVGSLTGGNMAARRLGGMLGAGGGAYAMHGPTGEMPAYNEKKAGIGQAIAGGLKSVGSAITKKLPGGGFSTKGGKFGIKQQGGGAGINVKAFGKDMNISNQALGYGAAGLAGAGLAGTGFMAGRATSGNK